MKRLFLPLALLTFTVICLSIVHIDNVNKLNAASDALRQKYDDDTFYDDIDVFKEVIPNDDTK